MGSILSGYPWVRSPYAGVPLTGRRLRRGKLLGSHSGTRGTCLPGQAKHRLLQEQPDETRFSMKFTVRSTPAPDEDASTPGVVGR